MSQQLPDWGPEAACAGKDVDDFFVDDVAQDAPFPSTVYSAMKVCSTCPFQRQCLQWAYQRELMDRGELSKTPDSERQPWGRRFGIFGGCPGRVRERMAKEDDPIGACMNWFRNVAREKQWSAGTEREEATA